MKIKLVVCLVLATSLLGQAAVQKAAQVSAVAGESWLNHIHRPLEETSMGKTGRLGPPTLTREEDSASQSGRVSGSDKRWVTLHGSDLYRLNCQGCHGEFGFGAPPEINSVINPTLATSVALTIEKMKKLGMDISRADAAQMANQSKSALLDRLHKGGTDMPPFPHLSEPEIRAIFAYLKQLAGVPGAEKLQETVEESPVRVGEHVVKSTCHICHNAAGPNPDPEQLFSGAIPPLSSLTGRTSLPDFAQKIRSGAPIMMGTPLAPYRGRMPVFYYLSEEEAADAYLYLKQYPPYEQVVLNPVEPAPGKAQASSRVAPVALENDGPKPPSGEAPETRILSFSLIAEVLVGLLMGGGLGYSIYEVRRLAAKGSRRIAVVEGGSLLHGVPIESGEPQHHRSETSDSEASDQRAAVSNDERETGRSRFEHDDHRLFESSWLSRRLERGDWAA